MDVMEPAEHAVTHPTRAKLFFKCAGLRICAVQHCDVHGRIIAMHQRIKAYTNRQGGSLRKRVR